MLAQERRDTETQHVYDEPCEQARKPTTHSFLAPPLVLAHLRTAIFV